MLAAKRTAATTAAAATLKTMASANANFVSRYHASYSPSFGALSGAAPAAGAVAPCTAAALLPTNLSGGTGGVTAVVGGYTFTYLPGAADTSDATCNSVVSYQISAVPLVVGSTGDDSFLLDGPSFTIYDQADGSTPTTASPVLQ